MSLNKLDLQILYELDKNSRLSYSQIARKLNVSKQTIKNRLDKLIDNKIIRSFFSIIAESNFDIKPLQVFIALNRVSDEKHKEIVDYLLNNPKIPQLTICEGIYDLIFGVFGTSPEEIDHELSEIYEHLAEYIKDKKLVFFVDTHLFTRDYLLKKERPLVVTDRGFHSPRKDKIILNENDFKVMVLLAKEPRIAATEIANRTGLSVQTVIKKIKFLEKTEIIKGYSYLFNPQHFLNHQILIEFSVLTKDLEKRVVNFCAAHPNALFLVKYLGEYDFSINIESLDHNSYLIFVNEFKKEFSSYLKSFVPILITDYSKLEFMP